MAGVAFDPEVVLKQADALYADAQVVVRNWTLLGAVGGFVAGAGLGGPWSLLHLGATVVGVGAGFVTGGDRSRRLRVEAQMLLCELKVEENTRAWIAQSRLALNKLTAAIDKLPLERPVAPAPAPAATPAPGVTAPAPAPAPVATRAPEPPRPVHPAAVPPEQDEKPSWAVETPRNTSLDHLEYVMVSPSGDLVRSRPPTPEPEGDYVPDYAAMDDDGFGTMDPDDAPVADPVATVSPE